MKGINERLIIILKQMFNGNVSEFARISNIPQPTLNNIVGNRLSSPSAENLERLVNSIESIDANWLLTGKGDMFKTNYQNSENNSGTGIIGNNVNGGGINDNKIILQMVELLRNKDDQINQLLNILEKK